MSEKLKLIICDIDNTLVKSYAIYDEAYRLASREVLHGKEFIMTANPDGSPDTNFSKMSNPEILQLRLKQLGIDPATVDVEYFFKKFAEHAKDAAKTANFVTLEGVVETIKELSRTRKLVLLSSGSRGLQIEVLKRVSPDFLKCFDLAESLFLGEYETKTKAIESISRKIRASLVVHVGDAPNDMTALKDAQLDVPKFAIGVTASGMSTREDLARADFIIEKYDPETLKELEKII
jgi:phosphoglycolate phosphatase-like HAD superfamily hydrolase